MALLCSVVLSTTSYAAGSTPPPTASVVVGNNGASAVVVMGVQLHGYVFGSNTAGNPVPMANSLPPYGPGAPVTVAAGGSATVGPFPVTVGSVAAANGGNSQPTQPATFILMVGATVLAQGGGVKYRTEAGAAGMTVRWTVPPLPQSQGGQFIFSRPSNSLFLLAGWL
jgi:hypothetical protein